MTVGNRDMYDTAALASVVEDLLKRRPFVRFSVVLMTGLLVEIRDPGQARLAAEGELLYVAQPGRAASDVTDVIALKHVVYVKVFERLTPGD